VIQFALQSVTISKVCRLQLLKAIRGHIFAGITVLVLGEMGGENNRVLYRLEVVILRVKLCNKKAAG